MKILLIATLILTCLPVMANIRGFSVESPNRAIVTIRTEAGESQRPSVYVDGEDNEFYLFEMMKIAESRVAKLRAEIELEKCGINSTFRERFIDGCGAVEMSAPVKVSRTENEATYQFKMGLRTTADSRSVRYSHVVTFTETVRFQYTGMLYKTLKVTTINAIP